MLASGCRRSNQFGGEEICFLWPIDSAVRQLEINRVNRSHQHALLAHFSDSAMRTASSKDKSVSKR